MKYTSKRKAVGPQSRTPDPLPNRSSRKESGQLPAPISFCWNAVFNRGFIITFTHKNRLPSGSEFLSMASPHTDMDNAIATAAHSFGMC